MNDREKKTPKSASYKPFTPKQVTGNKAEQTALDFLQQQGCTLLRRNYRCKTGEIDLVMQQGDEILFVEVRCRRNRDFGGAEASISPRKQLRITRTALQFLARHATDQPFRFDVIAIHADRDRWQIDWLQNAFQPVETDPGLA